MDNLNQNHNLAIFQDKKIRRIWDNINEKWYFSIVDIIAVLTETNDPNNYWKVLKFRLKKEGNESVTNCNQLKMQSSDGKFYLTDAGDTELILRLVQSIPSPKAEPFKLWLAKVGYQRIEEIQDPELSFNRAIRTYLQKGYSPEWINQRLKTIEIRKELTDEWNRAGIDKESDFAILTNELTKAWSGKTVAEYQELKNLKNENLRDNMTSMESVLNMLAEAATTEFSKKQNPQTFHEAEKTAVEGGAVAGNARKELEDKLGEAVVSRRRTKKKVIGTTGA
jgi:hypothetical protein